VPAAGLSLVTEPLLARAMDEPFTLYPLLAESVAVAGDRSWVEFTLDARARFHDGAPVGVDDVLFSWRALRDHGRPNHRLYYREVARAEATGPRRVRFTFRVGANAEMPLIMGLMPVVSRAHYEAGDFAKAGLDPPLGSGPYRVAKVDPGRMIEYERVADYWGRDLPVNRGRHNFDRITFTYYRDAAVALEAFLAGEVDLRFEGDPGRWARSYNHPAVARGDIRREVLGHGRPAGMTGLVFNTRRTVFADRRVRAALARAFAFEWINSTYFHGATLRNDSFFANSELAARGALSEGERALLEPWRGVLPDSVFEPLDDAPSTRRERLRDADAQLAEAGWPVQGGVRALAFEILLVDPTLERVALAYAGDLAILGVAARVRTVDSAQYQARLEAFDFDMVANRWGQSLSPGNEQRYYWSSQAADSPGSRNLAGVREPAVDALVARIADSRDRASLVTAARALDRVLRAGHYVVPLTYLPADRIAFSDRLARPAVVPLYGVALDRWWAKAR
jgi:microcin C transport system substrate-binding protein